MIYIDNFLKHLENNHYSKVTIKDYKETLNSIKSFFNGKKLVDEKKFTENDIVNYLNHLEDINATDNVRYRSTQRLRTYFNYLEETGIIFISPVRNIELPKKVRKPSTVLSMEEVDLLFSRIKTDTDSGIRFRAIMELMYSSALRPREVRLIMINDIDFAKKVLVIRQSKGNKDRVVPLTTKAVEWTQKYKNDVRPKYETDNNSNYLFLSHHSTGEPLTAKGLRHVLARSLEKYKIKHFSPSIMRATSATHLLIKGMNIFQLQELLGHSEPATTQIYLRTNVRDLQKILEEDHPRVSFKEVEKKEVNKQPRFLKYIEKFDSYLTSRAYSKRTNNGYIQCIKQFISFLQDHYPRIKELGRINKNVINDYCSYLSNRKTRAGKPLSNSTLRQKLISLKTFFDFLAKQDYILKSPAEKLELPRVAKTLPRNVLTEKEVIEMLNAPDIRTPSGMRDKALIEICYACGIRTSELLNLKISDIDLTEQTVTIVKGKGGKTRLAPLTQYATEYIKLYLEKGRKFLLKGVPRDEGYLLLSNLGQPISRHSINKSIIQPLAKKANIEKHVTIYSFRHGIATHLVKKGVDIQFVAELLGHNSIRTTQKYCHLNINDLKKVHSLYHPRESDQGT